MSEKNYQKKKTVKEGNKNTVRERYLKELESMLKDVPDEGLQFLVRQAAVLIHNASVEAENIMQIRPEKKAAEEKKADSKSSVIKGAETSGKKAVSETEKTDVSLEKGAFGKTFILRFGGTGKAFAEEEIAALIKYVHESESAEEGQRRIFAWFNRNRKDVLVDTGISSEKSPAVKGVYSCLKEKISK